MHEYRSNRLRQKKEGHCVLTKSVAAMQPLPPCLLESSVSHAQGTWQLQVAEAVELSYLLSFRNLQLSAIIRYFVSINTSLK